MMPMKGGRKNPQGPPLHPYEEERLRQCMQNIARLQQLGISDYTAAFQRASVIHKDKRKKNQRNREGCESDYDPSEDSAEQELVHHDIDKGSTGMRFCSRKRVYPEIVPTEPRRSKRIISQLDASPTPCGNHVPAPSHPDVSQADEPAGIDEATRVIPQDDGHINLGNEDCNDEHHENTMADIADIADDNQMTNEGGEQPWKRGVNMGHGLQKMNRSRHGKLPIIISEGHIRPLVYGTAGKYATECNIAVRNHVPVLKHRKEYKKHPAVIELYLGKLRAKFNIDTNDAVARNGCIEMMKTAVRQWRHKLKQRYFDPFPLHLVMKTSPVKSTTNDQWIDLVESWKTPQKMEACQKNKDNRDNVKFPQTTGSCSYEVFLENLGDESEDDELDAFELFKVCHFSKKTKGFTPTVQLAITEMENQLAAQPAEGEEPKSKTQVVADVLEQNTKKNRFLQNVGIQTARRPRFSD